MAEGKQNPRIILWMEALETQTGLTERLEGLSCALKTSSEGPGGTGWHWVAQAWGAPGGVVGSWPPARCRGVPGAVQPPAVPCSGQHTQRRGMPSTGPAEQEAMTRRKSGSGLRLGWGSGEGLPALIVRWCEAGGCGRVIFGTPPTPQHLRGWEGVKLPAVSGHRNWWLCP